MCRFLLFARRGAGFWHPDTDVLPAGRTVVGLMAVEAFGGWSVCCGVPERFLAWSAVLA